MMMALGERFKGSGARGIARFLSEHQNCDSGFDVRRGEAATGGPLRITCEGCGASIDYNAAAAGEAAAAAPPPPPTSNGAAGVEAAPSAPAPAARPAAEQGAGEPGARTEVDLPQGPAPPTAPRQEVRPRVTPRPQRHGVRRWLPPLLIGGLIVAGLVMIVIGLARTGDEQGGEPAAPAASDPAPGGTAPPSGEESSPQPEPAGQAPETTAGTLRTRSYAGRFAIGAPPGWAAAERADGVTLESQGATAEVSVFFGPSTLEPAAFASASQGFLADRHQGAQVGPVRSVRFRGRPAARVRVAYPGGEEVATFVAAGGIVFALIRRVDRGTSEQILAEADAAVASFRPAP